MTEAADAPIADSRTEGNPPALITVFTKNACPKCTVTHSKFDKSDVPHRTINVETDQEPRAEFADADGNPRSPFDYVVQTYGRAMPAVEVLDAGSGETVVSWNDMNPDRISEVVSAYGTK